MKPSERIVKVGEDSAKRNESSLIILGYSVREIMIVLDEQHEAIEELRAWRESVKDQMI